MWFIAYYPRNHAHSDWKVNCGPGPAPVTSKCDVSPPGQAGNARYILSSDRDLYTMNELPASIAARRMFGAPSTCPQTPVPSPVMPAATATSSPGSVLTTGELAAGSQDITAIVAVSDDDREKQKRRVHGWLMITAWCFIAPSAVLIKRLGHCQREVRQATVGEGARVPWALPLHAMLLAVAVILTIAGAALSINGFKRKLGANYGHQGLGMAVLVMACYQPLPAACAVSVCSRKCRKEGSAPRKMSRCVHLLGAFMLFFMALWNIFTGIRNFEE